MPLLYHTLLVRFLLRCVRGHVRRDGDVHGEGNSWRERAETEGSAPAKLSLAAWEAQRDK